MSNGTAWEGLKMQVENRKVIDVQLAELVFSESLSSENGYYEQGDHTKELESLFLQSELRWVGSSDSFHNLAVDLSKAGRNHSACIVLEKGLLEYPCSVDLLGDFLKYGVDDMRWEQCEKCYCVLNTLDRSDWNWRAYSFSIDYLLEKRKKAVSAEERKELRTEVVRLAKAFVNREKSDLAYYDLSHVYCELNKKAEEEATLNTAISASGSSPRCSLRLADIEITAGNYSKALERLKVCQTSLKPQSDINLAYVYLLKMLCESSILLSRILEGSIDKSALEEEAIAIYKDYNSAYKIGLDSIMQKTAKAVIAVIENQSGVKNNIGSPDAFGF